MIEKQDLVLVAKAFAGQKTSVDMVRKFGTWGYNRSVNLLEMAVELGVADRLEGAGGVVFKNDDSPQLGKVMLACRPAMKW